MIKKEVLIMFAVFMFASSHVCYALPHCSNDIINDVTTRIGCNVGDSRCWLSKGGYCTDYIKKMAWHGQPGKAPLWEKIKPEDVKKGDVALFVSHPHYSYVESVVYDKNGKPVSVNISEYNYGACWVDQQNMVTDMYKKEGKRYGITVDRVDGGFLRNR